MNQNIHMYSKKFKVTNRDNLESLKSKKNVDIVNMSSLINIPYDTFVNKFIVLCRRMIKSFNTNIVYVVFDDAYSKLGNSLYDIIIGKESDNTKYRNCFAHNLHRLICEDTVKLKQIPNMNIIFSNMGKWFFVNTSLYKSQQNEQFDGLLSFILLNNQKSRGITGIENNDKVYIDKDTKKKTIENMKNDIVNVANIDQTDDLDISEDELKKINNICAVGDDYNSGNTTISSARKERLNNLNIGFLKKNIHGKNVNKLIEKSLENTPIPETAIKINSPNEEWKHMNFINFNKTYDIDEDIALILNSFSNKIYPLSVKNVDVTDTSTALDYVNTYKIELEDMNGKRFTIYIDIPKLVNNRFLMIRSNPKVISGQLINLPCTKTDEDTVQLVTNYNKIFVYRYGTIGKSSYISDVLIRALNKYNNDDIKISTGNNLKICSKYNLPINYIDLAANFNYIETKNYIFYFDQDKYYKDYPNAFDSSDPNVLPFAVDKNDGKVLYNSSLELKQATIDSISDILCEESDSFKKLLHSIKPSKKYMYSRVKIMNGYIPTIVMLSCYDNIFNIMKKANVSFEVLSKEEYKKREKIEYHEFSVIPLNDGYIIYRLTNESSMLMNGLMECEIDQFTIDDISHKSTWVTMLDKFGGKFLIDGLDAFKELFLDPISEEVCKDYKIPTDFISMLLYANSLLSDNSYIKHTDITGNRYRTTEIIAGHLYKELAKSYEEYMRSIRLNRKNSKFSIKRSAVIDAILANPVTTDLSVMSPLFEVESNYSASFKGLSGLNTSRAYGLDKRTYDDSMLNKLSLSTNHAVNIGINRQATMDMNVVGKRGYIMPEDNNKDDDVSLTKRLCVTEAITPFGTTRDDPIRSAMSFVQTSKHSMTMANSSPLLVTNGADEAMPYMVSEEYVFRAKKPGKVVEIRPNEYMIIQYNDNTSDYISLRDEVKKNSDGGFYVSIMLVPNMKLNQKFKENEIVAYDNKSFSNKIGEADGLSYNVGILAKIAILASDEGFEDATSISEWLSNKMGTNIVTKIPVVISPNTNIYDVKKIGTKVSEGDPLMIIQDTVDDKDAAILLNNITDKNTISDFGRIPIKSKYTGYLQDIKIYRTCELDEMSNTLKDLVLEYNKRIKKTHSIYKKYNARDENYIEPMDKLPPIGNLKNVEDGVLIEFYINYYDTMGVGDKLTLQAANKGTIKMIFPKGKEPYTKSHPDEKIHAIASSRSFNARMVTSPIVSGAINKGLIELDRQVKEIMGLKYTPIDKL